MDSVREPVGSTWWWSQPKCAEERWSFTDELDTGAGRLDANSLAPGRTIAGAAGPRSQTFGPGRDAPGSRSAESYWVTTATLLWEFTRLPPNAMFVAVLLWSMVAYFE